MPYTLERTVVIKALPERVFAFFTDSARWAVWWGAGSTIDARPGGKMYIRHGNGVEVFGEVVSADAPRSIIFTYGPASQVTIRLTEDPAGTKLRLFHEFEDEKLRDQHIQGWRFQLSLFANVVSNEVFAGASAVVDDWFAAWLIADAVERDAALARIATPGISFKDRYSLLEGTEDVSAHIAAALRFMPGISLKRKGSVQQCQGTVLAGWAATGPDGGERMTGTSVFVMNADGRIESVVSVGNAG